MIAQALHFRPHGLPVPQQVVRPGGSASRPVGAACHPVDPAAAAPTGAGVDHVVVVRTAAGRAAIRRRHRKAARLRPPSGVLPSGAGPVAAVTADRLALVADRPLPVGRWTRLAATLVVVAAVAAVLVVALRPAPPTQVEPVRVVPGDTLWSLAHRAQPDADPRAVIEQIQSRNGLPDGAVLPVGTVLQIPVAAP